jgi:hypothetical protein
LLYKVPIGHSIDRPGKRRVFPKVRDVLGATCGEIVENGDLVPLQEQGFRQM